MPLLSSINVHSTWIKYLAAGTAAFIGYAIYIDRKRRLDPEYKQKIRQNRKLKQERCSANFNNDVEFPDPRDMQGNEAFFFSQVTLGEEKMQAGNVEEGIVHLSYAVVTCAKPAELLKIFQQTIPAEHYQLLIQALPNAKRRQQASLHQSSPQLDDTKTSESVDIDNAEGPKKVFLLQDDDLE